jgi:hypothetical protein
VLHGPFKREGMVMSDWEAWQAMEAIYDRVERTCLASAMSV